MLSLWDVEKDSRKKEGDSYYKALMDVTDVLARLAKEAKWILPLVIGHDVISLQRNAPSFGATWHDLVSEHDKCRCCSRHVVPLLLEELFEIVDLLQDTLFCWDVKIGSTEAASKEKTMIKLQKIQDVLGDASDKASHRVSSSVKSTKEEEELRTIGWFNDAVKALKSNCDWQQHESEEFDFIVKSICDSQNLGGCEGKHAVAGQLDYGEREVDFLIKYLKNDTSINKWTSIRSLRLLEGIVTPKEQSATLLCRITSEQQKELCSLCFNILAKRLGEDAHHMQAGVPSNKEVLLPVIGLAIALLSENASLDPRMRKLQRVSVQNAVYSHLKNECDVHQEQAFVIAAKRFLRNTTKGLNPNTANDKSYEALDGSAESMAHLHVVQQTLRLLQLMCEGHHTQCQNYLRDQGLARQIDLVGETADFFGALQLWRNHPSKKDHCYNVIVQALDTLTEYVQGPCHANQESIVEHGFLTHAMSLLCEFGTSEDLIDEENLKGKVAITLQVCLVHCTVSRAVSQQLVVQSVNS